MNELSLYILDITENSIHALSKNIHLTIHESIANNLLSVIIEDDGKGMSEDTLNRVQDPFYTTRTTRKVGMGIPLFKELCELCEGQLHIDSVLGKGTKLIATFKLDNIDLPPLGNIVDTLYVLITNGENVDIYYKQIKDDKEFSFNTKEIKEVLDGVPLSDPQIMLWFKDFVTEGINSLNTN